MSAKISKDMIGKGTATTTEARAFVRLLGKADDDVGHAIGNNLGGPGGKTSGNIFPQSINVNIIEVNIGNFENEIADAVMNGSEVHVKITPKYSGGSTRPYEIEYAATIDGVIDVRVFENP